MAVGGGGAWKLFWVALGLVCLLGCIVPGRGHDRGCYNFGMGWDVGNVQRHDSTTATSIAERPQPSVDQNQS